ncbi:MAG: hypothetical protein MK198_08040 [Gracilimonas sp.]|uniref:DoxX family protein n=1 Tax=Gracilimonas sp. TaxID=1974203 RepID=UPI00375161A7|nr:hypothetical protein [Gracilimonas sp.]
MNTMIANIGRYMYALPFAIFGLLHFMNANAMSGMVPIPGGVFWVYLTGVALIGAATAIIIQQKVSIVALLLGIMLLIFVLSIHLPGVISGGEGMQASMSNMLKDLALSGTAFFISGVYSSKESLTDSE